jgi:hypothetical protein
MNENNPWICVHGHDSRKIICTVCGLLPSYIRPEYNYEYERPKKMTDHAAATAEALEKVIAMLKAGQSPEDLGPMVILIGRMMARRT